jgi:hypothetical protein
MHPTLPTSPQTLECLVAERLSLAHTGNFCAVMQRQAVFTSAERPSVGGAAIVGEPVNSIHLD